MKLALKNYLKDLGHEVMVWGQTLMVGAIILTSLVHWLKN